MEINDVSLETKHVPAVGTWSFYPDNNPSSLFHFSTCSDNLQGSICTHIVFYMYARCVLYVCMLCSTNPWHFI